jgi:hypothetical protein
VLYIRPAFGAKSIIFLIWGLSFLLLIHDRRLMKATVLLYTLQNHVQFTQKKKGPWWSKLVLHKDQNLYSYVFMSSKSSLSNLYQISLLHVEDETRYSVHGGKKVAESESPCILLGTVVEVKRQNQLSASTFAILADGLLTFHALCHVLSKQWTWKRNSHFSCLVI